MADTALSIVLCSKNQANCKLCFTVSKFLLTVGFGRFGA